MNKLLLLAAACLSVVSADAPTAAVSSVNSTSLQKTIVPPCEDKSRSCAAWALDGYCGTSPFHDSANAQCQLSCKHCGDATSCVDKDKKNCAEWKKQGLCTRTKVAAGVRVSKRTTRYQNYVVHHCKKTCEICAVNPQGTAPAPAPVEPAAAAVKPAAAGVKPVAVVKPAAAVVEPAAAAKTAQAAAAKTAQAAAPAKTDGNIAVKGGVLAPGK